MIESISIRQWFWVLNISASSIEWLQDMCCLQELLEKELFDHLMVFKQKIDV